MRAATVRWRSGCRARSIRHAPWVAELHRGIDDLDTVGESLQRASGHGGNLEVSVGKPQGGRPLHDGPGRHRCGRVTAVSRDRGQVGGDVGGVPGQRSASVEPGAVPR